MIFSSNIFQILFRGGKPLKCFTYPPLTPLQSTLPPKITRIYLKYNTPWRKRVVRTPRTCSYTQLEQPVKLLSPTIPWLLYYTLPVLAPPWLFPDPSTSWFFIIKITEGHLLMLWGCFWGARSDIRLKSWTCVMSNSVHTWKNLLTSTCVMCS